MPDDPRGTRAEAGAPTADGSVAAPGLAPTAAATPVPHVTGVEETIIPSWGSTTFASLPDPGYQLGDLIGRGGMGEIVVAQDQRIGREVAVKRIRSREPSPDAVSRFLREARIQARLDHPAIVPVYELGTDADGRPYFTMKRLAGETLAKRLLYGGPVQPLLRAFVDVCMAIELAHSRGVVHRDLKPSNIMLGDYGEVYVLDWGVARVLTDTKRTTSPAMMAQVDEETTAGAILGTPGYMAPEQVRGHEAGIEADIYALGAILFEILAGEPLHPRGEAALSSTLTRPQEAPAARAAERRQIPPELDGVCFDALAEDPKVRPSARELADRVQAYLDGDRDIERRRVLADEQLALAQRALEEDVKEGRAAAVRYAGRALALHPESTEAAELISSLLLEPPAPEHMPPDLKEFLRAEDKRLSATRSRQGMWTYLSMFALWLAIPFLDVTSWTTLFGFYGLCVLGAMLAVRNARRGYSSVPALLVMTAVIPIVFTRMTGPFLLTPVVMCAAIMQLAAVRYIAERLWIPLLWCATVVMLPFVLEWTGVLNPSYAVGAGGIVTFSDVFDFNGRAEEIVLVATNLAFLIAAAVAAVYISRSRLDAQRELQIREWHLRQLLPSAKRRHTRV